jgi:hypothetical protein
MYKLSNECAKCKSVFGEENSCCCDHGTEYMENGERRHREGLCKKCCYHRGSDPEAHKLLLDALKLYVERADENACGINQHVWNAALKAIAVADPAYYHTFTRVFKNPTLNPSPTT